LSPAVLTRGGDPSTAAFEAIAANDLRAHVAYFADPVREGRDTPSLGLESSARYIRQQFARDGLACLPDSEQVWSDVAKLPLPSEDARVASGTAPARGTYLRPFRRKLPEPDPEVCSLALSSGAKREEFKLGHDFVPILGCAGAAQGELVFVGFAIDSKPDHYDDISGIDVRGKIALIVEGEPRHPRAFAGPVVSPAASLWPKVDKLTQLGVAGILAVRRTPELPEKSSAKNEHAPAAPSAPPVPGASDPKREGETSKRGANDASTSSDLGFRYEWALFNGAEREHAPKTCAPALEVSAACAAELLGEDVAALAGKIDKTLHPFHPRSAGRIVAFRSQTREAEVRADNVAGLVRGSDAKLAEEFVVVGAHYDHIGVDARGRIGYGADDNASGSAALLEIARALSLSPPRRSVILCSFAGEEEGLLGSMAFCARLPVGRDKIVAMVNLDMVGRGNANEVAVLGIVQNPALEKVLDRAKLLHPTGVQQIVMRQGEDLFQRSDHYSFHQLGIPVLFFFEGLPIEKNPDYHTWRDTPDLIDYEKVLHTTRLTLNTVWLLSNDEARPPKPQG
jgi:hypothetical protein